MNPPPPRRHTWYTKFANALRGIVVGTRDQTSFDVHLIAALAVIIVGWYLGVSRLEWCVLLLCIVAVLAAELFNSAFEQLAKAVTDEEHPRIRDALDVCSGAVLVASIGAAAVGIIILGGRAFGG
jgi:diacylglycerol kinase